MGNGIDFKCRGCGHILKLYEGYGFMSGDERMHRTDALNGVYGETARRIMAEEEDTQTLWKVHVYHCTCGNYQSGGEHHHLPSRKEDIHLVRKMRTLWEKDETDIPAPRSQMSQVR